MTYEQTLDWMFAQLPMYQQKGKSALNAKLDKIISFTDCLGNPEKKFKSVHVAGTNGKGSCSHMLASILQEAGYKTALYTSPHLKDFRERIKINGQPVNKEFVIDFIRKHKDYLEANQLSFFEMTVAMAFEFFAMQEVDIAIVEVGLGGRLDSTNIITPEVSLITNIGNDHQDFLGDTLPQIAVEKAGVIKKNVPVVISEYQTETSSVFKDIANDRNSRIVFAENEVQKRYETSLLGNYQTKNIKGVVATIRALAEFKVTENDIEAGLKNVVKNTGLMGRWQVLSERPKIVCDTAHNQEGIALVLDQVKRESFDKLHIVLGFVKDKSLGSILPLFPKDALYYFVKPNIPRGLDVTELQDRATSLGLEGNRYDSVADALMNAKRNASENDFVYIGGSTFVVAEVV